MIVSVCGLDAVRCTKVLIAIGRSLRLIHVCDVALLTVPDQATHAPMRRVMNAAFTTVALRDLRPIFNDKSSILVRKWLAKAAAGEVVSAHSDLTRMTVVSDRRCVCLALNL